MTHSGDAKKITGLKKAIEALKRSEERFRRLVEGSSQVIWIANAQGDITEDSLSWRAFTGRKYDQLAGWKWIDTIHPDDRQQLSDAWHKSIETATPCHVEFRQLNACGQYRNIVGTAVPIFDENNSVIEWIGMNQDVTERKRAEEALVKSEERYKLAERVTNIGSWDWNIHTGALAWSETIEPLFGFEKGKFGATYEAFLKCVHPDDRQRIVNAVNACVEKGGNYQIEHRIVWPDSSVHWVLETGDVIRDENGKAVRMLGIVQDITLRKKSEEALRASFARYRSYIEVTGQLGWTTNASGEVVDDIPSWRGYTGQSYGEVKGYGWTKAIHPDDVEQTIAAWTKATKEKSRYETEYRVRRHDGAYRNFLTRGVPVLEDNGNIREWVGTCIDITDRIKAEEALKHEKEFSENILRTMPDGLDIVDESLNIVYMNKTLQDAFGKDCVGKKCYEIYRTNGKQCENCPLKDPLNGSTKVVEVSGIRDGKTFLISHTSINMNGKRHVLEIFSDISERKEIEEKLLKLSRAVEQSHASVVITDIEGFIEYVNPHFTHVTGYNIEEVVGKTPRILKSGKQPVEIYKDMWNTIKSGRDWQGEFCNKKKNGELYWELVSISPVKDAEGNVIRFVAIKEDITEKKITEELIAKMTREIEREKGILKTIMENTEAHLAYLDMNFNFISVNTTYAKGSGHTIEELIGKNHFEFFPNKENEAIFRHVRDTGEPVILHARPFVYAGHPEQGVTYWDYTLVPIKDVNEKAIGLVLSLIDITHRKAIEDALKDAYQKLKKISEMKSSILRDVSHELKHPISLITMATNFVEDEIKKGLPDKNKALKYVDMLKRNSNMFEQKLASVLELSRLETVESMSMDIMDISSMISDIIKQNFDAAREKGIEMQYDARTVTIRANKTMLHSLVNNLVVNAIKYSKKGIIEIICRKEGSNAVISVKDNGIGIRRESINKIFEPFFKEDLSSEGVGVGLAICKKVAELHGGTISVHSALGKGSTFVVALPIKNEPPFCETSA